MKGLDEKAIDVNGNPLIKIDKNYFRPTEVDTLLGDATKARNVLGWKPKMNIHDLIKDMIKNESKY